MVKVKSSWPKDVLSFTSWGFGVIAVELLELLGSDATSSLRLGNLADASGDVIEEFRTFVGIEHVVLRGSRESEHRICKSCGALVYTYVPRDSPYLTPSQVVSRRPIFEIESMQLLVDESIRARIGNRWAKSLVFYEVPILELPLDGLPVDMGLWPTPEQLAGYQPNPPKWMKS